MLIGYGSHEYALSQLIPAIDISKPVAMAILPGTPMMPKSAALALWVGKPGDQNSGIFVSINANLTPYILYSARQNDFSGIALAIDHTAISTFSNRLVDPQTLHNVPIRRTDRGLTAEGLPVCQQLAGGKYAVCSAARGRLRPAGGAALLLRADDQIDPRKSILLGIKNNQFYIV